MDSKDKRNKDRHRLLRSFSFAFAGIKHVITTERNMQIHLMIAVLVIMFGFAFSISPVEWLFVFITISHVFTLEIINSSIERVVDLVSKEYAPLAKQAKDASAGAVLVSAIFAVIIGLIIFLPKCYALLF